MKRSAIKTTMLYPWKAQWLITCMVILCLLCPLFRLPASDTWAASLPLAASNNLQSSPKTAAEIEYEVKAAFIYNFMKFIEWPEENTKDQNSRQVMVIGILGDNPFGKAFVPILDKEVHGRKINLVEIPSYQKFYESASDKRSAFEAYRNQYQQLIDSCDVLFICLSEESHVDELTKLAPGRGILTISDITGFAKHHGIVGFVKDNNKIRFEINLYIAQKENFKIRSQLLALAKEVYEKK